MIDDTVAHASTRSLRGGAEQYTACMAPANIAGENELYARSWIRLGAPSNESWYEIGFLELGPTLADNPGVRGGVRPTNAPVSGFFHGRSLGFDERRGAETSPGI